MELILTLRGPRSAKKVKNHCIRHGNISYDEVSTLQLFHCLFLFILSIEEQSMIVRVKKVLNRLLRDYVTCGKLFCFKRRKKSSFDKFPFFMT